MDFLTTIGNNADKFFNFVLQLVLFIISIFATIYDIFVFLITFSITLFSALLNFLGIFLNLLLWIILNPFLIFGIIECYCIGLAVIDGNKDNNYMSKAFTTMRAFLSHNKTVIIAIYDFGKWYFTQLNIIIPKIIEFIIRIVDIIVPDFL